MSVLYKLQKKFCTFNENESAAGHVVKIIIRKTTAQRRQGLNFTLYHAVGV